MKKEHIIILDKISIHIEKALRHLGKSMSYIEHLSEECKDDDEDDDEDDEEDDVREVEKEEEKKKPSSSNRYIRKIYH